jgi:hypothetical protein
MNARLFFVIFFQIISLSISAYPVYSFPIQTEITPRDEVIIDRLISIARQNSASIKEATAASGFSVFDETITLGISPFYSSGSFVEEREQFIGIESKFSVELTINPLKIISALEKRPALQAKLQEAHRQKRVEVVKFYIAYLIARQGTKIAQTRIGAARANKTLPNPEYIAAAKEMLSANTQERLAAEELAAAVGLSRSELLKIMLH